MKKGIDHQERPASSFATAPGQSGFGFATTPGQEGAKKKEFKFWILDSGFWILDSGFWILDSGFWILDSGFWDDHTKLQKIIMKIL